jgi:hypothetical protein
MRAERRVGQRVKVGPVPGTIIELIPDTTKVIVRLDNERQIRLEMRLLVPLENEDGKELQSR